MAVPSRFAAVAASQSQPTGPARRVKRSGWRRSAAELFAQPPRSNGERDLSKGKSERLDAVAAVSSRPLPPAVLYYVPFLIMMP